MRPLSIMSLSSTSLHLVLSPCSFNWIFSSDHMSKSSESCFSKLLYNNTWWDWEKKCTETPKRKPGLCTEALSGLPSRSMLNANQNWPELFIGWRVQGSNPVVTTWAERGCLHEVGLKSQANRKTRSARVIMSISIAFRSQVNPASRSDWLLNPLHLSKFASRQQ